MPNYNLIAILGPHGLGQDFFYNSQKKNHNPMQE